MSGCGPDVEERIAGPWLVDADRWMADPSLAELPPDDRAPLEAIARGLVAETRFDFSGGECRRSTAGRATALPCRIHAVEQGVVVLRATASDGAVHWIRVKPEGATARVTWGGRTLPLRRASAAATFGEAEK